MPFPELSAAVRRVLRLAVLAVAVPIFATGAVASSAYAATPVKLVFINITDCLPLFVAEDKGLFEKHGISVEATAVANQSVTVASLVSGAADLGFSVPPTIIQARDSGIDLSIVAGAVAFPLPKPAYAGVLARTGSDIHSAKDLVGHKVAVVGLNAFHHLMARRWLKEQGADPDKVTFVELPLPQMPDLMKAGQVDAVVTVDPFYNRMISDKTGYDFGDYLATVPEGTPVDFFVANKAWADGHSDTVRNFRAALEEAETAIRSDDAAARASLAKWTKLPAPVIATTRIPSFTVPVSAAQMDWWVDLARKEKLITGDMKGSDFIIPVK